MGDWTVQLKTQAVGTIESAIARIDGHDVHVPLSGERSVSVKAGVHVLFARIGGNPGAKWRVELSSTGLTAKPDVRVLELTANAAGRDRGVKRFTLKDGHEP